MMLPLLILATLAHSTAGRSTGGPEIFVRTSPTVSVDRLAAAVRPMGFIESRSRGTRSRLIQLNPGQDAKAAKQALEKVPGVTALEPAEEPVDMNSVRSIHRKIAHLEQFESDTEGQAYGHRTEKESGADYLKAYEYFIGSRAFPNDSFDWSILTRAKKHADQMPATKFRQNRPGAKPQGMVQSWEFSGPTNLQVAPNTIDFGLGTTNGRVNAVAFDPLNSNVIYAGAAAGGLWKSIDGGSNWVWLSSTWPQLAVNCIAIDPVDPFVIYVGMGDYHGGNAGSYGVMKSTDGGITWSEILTSTSGNIGVPSLLIDPTNHNTIIAGTGDSASYGNMYVSHNGGQTWAINYYFGQYQDTQSWFPTIVAAAPIGNNVNIYAVLAGIWADTPGYGRIVVSADHGDHWYFCESPMSDSGKNLKAFTLAASPTNPNALYALDSQSLKLYSTQNGGQSWQDLSANLPLGGTNGTGSNATLITIFPSQAMTTILHAGRELSAIRTSTCSTSARSTSNCRRILASHGRASVVPVGKPRLWVQLRTTISTLSRRVQPTPTSACSATTAEFTG